MKDYYIIISSPEDFVVEMEMAGFDISGFACCFYQSEQLVIDWLGKVPEPSTLAQQSANLAAYLEGTAQPYPVVYKAGLYLNVRILKGDINPADFISTQFVEPETPYRVFAK